LIVRQAGKKKSAKRKEPRHGGHERGRTSKGGRQKSIPKAEKEWKSRRGVRLKKKNAKRM